MAKSTRQLMFERENKTSNQPPSSTDLINVLTHLVVNGAITMDEYNKLMSKSLPYFR